MFRHLSSERKLGSSKLRAPRASRGFTRYAPRPTRYAILICLVLLSTSLFAAPAASFDYAAFSEIPILHEGRMKPLDTFARTQLLAVSGKRAEKSRSAIEWFAELIFTPQEAYAQRIFRIFNPDVLAMMDIEAHESKRYTFLELYPALRKNEAVAQRIMRLEKAQRSPAQQQFVQLYQHAMQYYDLSRSLSLMLPTIAVGVPEIAQQMGIEPGASATYLELKPYESVVNERIAQLEAKDAASLDDADAALATLGVDLHFLSMDGHSQALRIIPPQWPDSDPAWLSPWQTYLQGAGAPQAAQYTGAWSDMAAAYINGDTRQWESASSSALAQAQQFHTVTPKQLLRELRYNQRDNFTKSYALYIAGFLLLAGSWLGWRNGLQRLAIISTSVGAGLHMWGMVERMLIMQRPPVTTLYESIIFVAIIIVLFGLIIEAIRRDSLGLLLATIAGAALHAIGRSYANDGDTMGQLVAVLNTNFWLATHVVTITIGYGCAFVAGLVAHIYLGARIFQPENTEKHQSLYKNMLGVALFALFFTLFGTILGGIWADQSWGRFWGWDPKENGALWIVLWLLWLLHGKIAGQLRPLGFAAGMICTNIIVALAWFGVNLLNVGLHSYGFTDSIAMNLVLFCGGELMLALGAYVWIRQKTPSQSAG